MWKPTKTRAEQQLAAVQKRDQSLIKQKEMVEKERDDRMARLRKLRLAQEAAALAAAVRAADPAAAEANAPYPAAGEQASEAPGAPPPVRVHPHRS